MTEKPLDVIEEKMERKRRVHEHIRSLLPDIILKIDNDECIVIFNGEMTDHDKSVCIGKYIKKIATNFTKNSTTDEVVAYMNKFIEDCLKENKDLDCLKLKNQ